MANEFDGGPLVPGYTSRGAQLLQATARKQASRTIKRVYTRCYSDTGQTKAYVEWGDGSRTEGDAEFYHGVLIPCDEHMGALFDRAIREGLTVEREVW